MAITYAKTNRRELALRILLARAWRENKMLREKLGDAAFETSRCPICFRDGPHGVDTHDIEDYAINGAGDLELESLRATVR